MSDINKRNECYYCEFCKTLPYSAHRKCTNPDHEMEGDEYGIASGWFDYPGNFDPVWKEKDCANFKPRKPVSSRDNFNNAARGVENFGD